MQVASHVATKCCVSLFWHVHSCDHMFAALSHFLHFGLTFVWSYQAEYESLRSKLYHMHVRGVGYM